eukprot:c20533_g1_i3 orf=431-793(-)
MQTAQHFGHMLSGDLQHDQLDLPHLDRQACYLCGPATVSLIVLPLVELFISNGCIPCKAKCLCHYSIYFSLMEELTNLLIDQYDRIRLSIVTSFWDKLFKWNRTKSESDCISLAIWWMVQ